MRHSAKAASPKMSCLIQRSPLPTPPGLFSSADQAYGGSRPCARQTERLRPAALSRGSIAALRVRFERSNGSAARVVPHFENLSAHLNAEPKIQCSEITLSEHSGHGWTRCWLGPVANDPERKWRVHRSTYAALKAPPSAVGSSYAAPVNKSRYPYAAPSIKPMVNLA